LTIKAASNKWHLKQFDITLAFTNAELTGLEKSIFVRLPKEWSGPEARQGDTVKLLRALYGLRLSPLLWYRTYKEWLESQGWVECEKEPGLFHYMEMLPDGEVRELWMTVYVDDSLICGDNEEFVDLWMKKILERFPGEPVRPKFVKKEVDGALREVEHRDILGADLFYCREAGWTCWSMEGAIDRMLAAHKFESGGRGTVTTPCQPHVDLTQGEPRPDYPLR
jgi:hypothetical protein